MKAPEKIYINGFSAFATVPVKEGIEYIRKDALLEWAKEQMRLWEDRALDAIHSDTKYPIIVSTFGLKRDMFKMFIDKLNSM